MSKLKNIALVVQDGRLAYEALLFLLSFRASNPDFEGRIILLEPQKNARWQDAPEVQDANLRAVYEDLGAEIIPFENEIWGQRYPHGNKIEALKAMPKGEPFVFFDTDTYFKGSLSDVPFDFARPSASLNVEGTWPKSTLYGPSLEEIWRALYERFELDFEASQEADVPTAHWRRYLYFNAGYFYGACPHEFGALFTRFASEIESDPGEALAAQVLYPWLDQIALPLVITALNGGRDRDVAQALDGGVSRHYRSISLFYARETNEVIDGLEQLVAPNKYKKFLKNHEPFKKLIFQGKGRKIRDVIDLENLPRKEEAIRKKLKNQKLWMR